MIWLSRIATVLALAGVTLSYFLVSSGVQNFAENWLELLATIVTIFSIIALWWMREKSHRQNMIFREQLNKLGLSFDDLGGLVQTLDDNVSIARNGGFTAFAVEGQCELATMPYVDLVARLKSDGHIN